MNSLLAALGFEKREIVNVTPSYKKVHKEMHERISMKSKILDLLKSGIDDPSEICQQVGAKYSYVVYLKNQRMRELGLNVNRIDNRISKIPEVVYLYVSEKKTVCEINKKLGLSIKYIRQVLKDRSVKLRPRKNNSKPMMITFRGVTKPMSAWAKDIGIDSSALSKRLKSMPLEDALTRSRGKKTTKWIKSLDIEKMIHLYRDQELTIREVSEIIGASMTSVRNRLLKTGVLRTKQEAKKLSDIKTKRDYYGRFK